MWDATVSDFFYRDSKSKKIKKFVFFMLGGGAVVGEGAIVREFL